MTIHALPATTRWVGIIYYYNSGPDATCQVDGREPADEQARSAVRPVDGSRFNFCDYSTPSGYTGPLLPHLCHCAEWPVHSGAAPTAVAWLRARARREACQHPWATARHAGRATRARGAAEGARSGRDQAGCEPSLPRGLAPLSFRWVGKSPVGAVESKTPWLRSPLDHPRRGTSAHTGHPSANAGLTALCRADFHGSATGDELHMARRGFLLNLAPATVYLAWTP